MISPKWEVLMAVFALVGAVSLPTTAFAQEEVDSSQNADVDIERNNEIVQENRQFQEACIGVAGPANIDDGDVIDIESNNRAEVEQGPNVCQVAQSQEATNAAAIVDESDNDFDVLGIIVGWASSAG
jgi:hypothetical protein